MRSSLRLLPFVLAALVACEDVDGGGEPTPPESNQPTPEPCTFEAALEVDRPRGVFPMPMHAVVTPTCAGDDLVVTWDSGDGATAEGLEFDHVFVGSGEFQLTATAVSGETPIVLTQPIEVGRSHCPAVGESLVLGSTASDELDEASGLAQSRKDSSILWTHNDSGDAPRLFAMSTEGEHLGTFDLEGAVEGDWEDSTIGVDPTTGETRLYVGDIGDNSHDRDAVLVHIVDEPDLDPAGGDQSGTITAFTTIEIEYPDGLSLDAETLLFDPVTGDLYLVAETEEGDVDLYRKAAPHEPGTRSTAERIANLNLDGKATGGDFAPDGHLMVVRTGTTGYIWVRDRSKEFVENLFVEPCAITLPEEIRGEGLAFSIEGDGFFTVSEEPHQPIHYIRLDPPEQPCLTLEARIVMTPPPGAAPMDINFRLDPECIFEELTSVSWDLGDGSDPITEEAHIQTYLSEGTHTVRVDLEDATGAISADEVTFEITPQVCPTLGDVEEWGSVDSGAVDEASGLVHSFTNPGVLWTHNDSGSDPELHAVGVDGANLGIWTVDGDSRDWEDLATGFNLEINAQALYVGDVGDNGTSRDDIKVFIVPEPGVDTAEEEVEETITDFGVMTLTYPDGPHNCESIFVDPVSNDLIVITKHSGGDTAVFRKPGPHTDGWEGELLPVTDIDLSSAPYSGSRSTTAADIHPQGHLVAVRTYSDVWLYRRVPGEPWADTFSRDPCDGRAPNEQQGEAVAFSTDGAGYIVVSEGDHQAIKYRDVIPVPTE